MDELPRSQGNLHYIKMKEDPVWMICNAPIISHLSLSN